MTGRFMVAAWVSVFLVLCAWAKADLRSSRNVGEAVGMLVLIGLYAAGIIALWFGLSLLWGWALA